MTRARALVLGIAGLVLAIAVGVATAGGTSVTITSPTPGSSISRSASRYLTVAGAARFASVYPISKKFYLRRDGCGTSNDNPHLSLKSGTDAGDGCGFIGGNGVASEVAPGLFSTDFPTSDGMPVILDATKAINGTFDLQNDVAGTGQVTLDFTLEAQIGGEGVVVGQDTETVLVTPAQSDYPTAFHITPDSTLQNALISGLDLHVFLHGAYSDSGYIGVSGKSYLTVAGFSASPNRIVQISLDDRGFASPKTATLNSTATGYSLKVATPTVGNHVVYARAIQGFNTSAIASSAFTVTQ